MRLPPLVALLLAAGPAWGQDASSPCVAAAAQAEVEAGVPAGLLAAIGRVESGRRNPGTGQTEAWPWTANAAGTGRYFASRQEAVAGVQQAQANGFLSIDVGCFQVNLMHHPTAFATLDEAFDPLANARYAARFLSGLRAGAGSWAAAAGQYHSATPGLGEPYAQRVMGSWQGGGTAGIGDAAAFTPAVLRVAPAGVFRPMVLPSLGSTSPGTAWGRPDPHVLVIRTGFTPGTASAAGMARDPHVIRIGPTVRRRGG